MKTNKLITALCLLALPLLAGGCANHTEQRRTKSREAAEFPSPPRPIR